MAWLNTATGFFKSAVPLGLTAAALATTALLSACNVGKSDTIENATSGGTGSSTDCAGTYTGRVDAPSENVRVANRNRQVAEGGVLGGGVDGGIYLAGAFGWQTDANCNIIAGNFILHGGYSTVTGNIKASGTSTINHEGGPATIIRNGTNVTGTVNEGGGREWVYGDLVGVFTPGGKL